MNFLSNLKREQKEAIGLLQIGTFLEYFDLMLYIHMAVLLNELFFPKTDQRTAALLSAFAFCSTYVFRPIGALLFGYIGDKIGRKAAIIISTTMMAISCFFMSILPTYAEIGLYASIGMIICRILQSFSATGEVIGAEIYLSELLKPPASYQVVSWLYELCTLGSLAALLAASLILQCNANWRSVFVFGGMIAFSGAVARRKLKETPIFLQSKANNRNKSRTTAAQVSNKTSLAFFLIYSGFPLCFYINYIYFADYLKNFMLYTSREVIHHNLLLTFLGFAIGISVILLSRKIHPLKILKIRGTLSAAVFIALPLLPLTNIYVLTIAQILLLLFSLETSPAISIFFQHFPVHCRFRYSSMLYAISRAMLYVTTSFGLVYLTNLLGNFGIWVIALPVSIGFLWGVHHFTNLDAAERALELAKEEPPFKEEPITRLNVVKNF